jgi:hypothetical protein
MENKEYICQYCLSTFKNSSNLKQHITGSKKCLKSRGVKIESKYTCKGCDGVFMTKINFSVHQQSCKEYYILKYKEENEELQQINAFNNNRIIELLDKLDSSSKLCSNLQEKQIKSDNLIKELQSTLEKVKVEQDNYLTLKVRYEELEKHNEKTITKLEQKIYQSDKVFQDIILNRIYNEADIELDESVEDNNINENECKEYKLKPLDLGNDMYIESREDGYINITNLFKAGDKLFDHWNSFEKTKAYLKALSIDIAITIPALITHQTGAGLEQKTWVHPYVAINIAQWISPEFDVKISSWIYEVMLTGKIDISKTKSFQQLRLENKEQKIKIQYLTKKYVKSQPRIQYTEQNVIYILTTPSHKKEGKYILGKATNLTNRLSVYNKTDEHEVVYYQSCGDEETMSIVEQFVFQRLKDYREQANRERFILPEGKTINLFIDVIKKTIG